MPSDAIENLDRIGKKMGLIFMGLIFNRVDILPGKGRYYPPARSPLAESPIVEPAAFCRFGMATIFSPKARITRIIMSKRGDAPAHGFRVSVSLRLE